MKTPQGRFWVLNGSGWGQKWPELAQPVRGAESAPGVTANNICFRDLWEFTSSDAVNLEAGEIAPWLRCLPCTQSTLVLPLAPHHQEWPYARSRALAQGFVRCGPQIKTKPKHQMKSISSLDYRIGHYETNEEKYGDLCVLLGVKDLIIYIIYNI